MLCLRELSSRIFIGEIVLNAYFIFIKVTEEQNDKITSFFLTVSKGFIIFLDSEEKINY